jgi:sulfite exporter TauE/SafE
MDLGALTPGALTHGLGIAAGLLAGLASSAHCGAMCGPLACAASAPALVPLKGRTIPNVRRWREPLAYHAARVVAYGALGATVGLAGQGVQRALAGVMPVLPWVMAAALIATGLGLGHRLPIPGALKRALAVWVRATAKFSPALRAGAIGAATPLLPCATLFGLVLAATTSGSGLAGAGLMGAFALGATPALALVQAHAPALRRHPRVALWVQRAVPLLAAAVLIWRAVNAGAGGGAAPGP